MEYFSKPRIAPRNRIPFEAYCLANGLIHQLASGLYVYMPWIKIMLDRIETDFSNLIENDLNGSRVEFTTLQPNSYFKDSGRYNTFKGELFECYDRKNRGYILSPTNEEVAAEIFLSCLAPTKSSRSTIYDIGKKFRDELGGGSISRTREFRMIEMYTRHGSESDMKKWGKFVSRKLIEKYTEINCEILLKDAQESVTSEFSGYSSIDFDVHTELNTGYSDTHGRLLQLAKWSPLGSVYFKETGYYMSCLGLGAMRVLLHLFEKFQFENRFGDTCVKWPDRLLPATFALIYPDRKSKYFNYYENMIQLEYKMKCANLKFIADSDRVISYSQRLRQLSALGIPNIIELTDSKFQPYRVTNVNGIFTDFSLDNLVRYLANQKIPNSSKVPELCI